jgi:hypothetical protein
LETHWELGEHIENLMGRHWELKGNTLGTKEKWKKNLSPPTLREKARHLECLLGPSPLAARNFSSQKSSTPKIIPPCKEHTTCFNLNYLKFDGICLQFQIKFHISKLPIFSYSKRKIQSRFHFQNQIGLGT